MPIEQVQIIVLFSALLEKLTSSSYTEVRFFVI